MNPKAITMEFHVSRQARDRYQFNENLFALSGNVILTNFHAARTFAQKMNARRDLVNFPETAIKAGQINAMGLIDEIMHMVVSIYRQQRNPQVMSDAMDWLVGMLGQDRVLAVLHRFAQDFPPLAVYRREISLEEYLNGKTEEVPHLHLVLEELLMLWLANSNPALAPYMELFDDSLLEKETDYVKLVNLLHAFFETQPTFGPQESNLIDMLQEPAMVEPHSLTGQLEYIRQRWGYLLGKYLYRLLSSLDLVREEEKAIFGVGGPGPALVVEFGGLELEPENFSQDKDWMPRLVLLAKNSYVWLDQLSKQYQRPIHRLDQIPDVELDRLARYGYSGLWLIGLWERSAASKTIKQLRGNPEAVASAYSLYDYQIANDLGGEEAYQDLRQQAWRRGIRLSSDMVPNHMGIDSRWVIEHPDWFISLDYPPFPTYTFSGHNLSTDQRVTLQIEDHYYNNSDAAVVFKRIDHYSGHSVYIYHGNDGTSMPWNDTAQLNYLKPEVREAVIQTILHVARKFPVIRFDAAMTLAKKHYQRLWFPEPGSGGDIASRAGYGLTKEQFDAAMPNEFWRDVVDRVAQEVPDTLLLAEAFWMMEGYFVRTLGMHRVYNSAFMNMLRDEKNVEYRLVIKNTLEFDPEILKRYVNFMNNPDERTAVDQFGKGDKYFGVCILMVTMPGLPMFGHGQIEGFTEKYGMEYRRAYWDEQVDSALVERHEREIFPLLRKRYLFADVNHFLLYDFYTPEGSVNEDVFAYSNRAGDERSLVLYHNRFKNTRGWIRTSAAFSVKAEEAQGVPAVTPGRVLLQHSLAEGLGLDNNSEIYTIFRDQISGLELIRNNRELHEQGLYVELEAYKYKVLLDFRQVHDNEWRQYAQLATYLNGRGVPNMDEAMKEIFLQPIHTPFRELINSGMLRWVITNRLQPTQPDAAGFETPPSFQATLDETEEKTLRLVSEIKRMIEGSGNEFAVTDRIMDKLWAALRLPALETLYLQQANPTERSAILRALGLDFTAKPAPENNELLSGDSFTWGALLAWLFIHPLGEISGYSEPGEVSRSWIDEWLLGKITSAALGELGLDEQTAARALGLVKLLASNHNWWERLLVPEREPEIEPETGKPAGRVSSVLTELLQEWLKDEEVRRFIGVNRYQGILWFNKESYTELLWWLFLAAVIDITSNTREDKLPSAHEKIAACLQAITQYQQAAQSSEYQLEKLVTALA